MNEQEFTSRVKACEGRLYRIAYSMLNRDADCSDAVQEALMSAFIHLFALRNEAYFETWLTRILINECKKLLRHRSRAPSLLPESLPERQPPDPVLQEALLSLDLNDRLALVLHYLEGYSVLEIAKMLRVPAGTVKSRLYRGRKRLKNQLAKEGWA